MQIAPQQVTPGENFTVFFFVRNHTDAATYYIQAKIYALDTQELLATVPLSQSPINSRLFYATVNAPGDQAGYGRDIVSIATVYTDSGFSSKSSDYEEQEQYFLVKGPQFVGVGGGVDYQVVREILEEQLEKALKPFAGLKDLKSPDAPDMSFVDALFGALGALQREVNRIPKEAADLQPLSRSLRQLQNGLDDLMARPEFERTDLSALAEAATMLQSAVAEMRSEGKVGNAQLLQSLDSALAKVRDEITTAVGAKVEETIQGQELTIPLSMNVKTPKKQEPAAAPDVRHLTG